MEGSEDDLDVGLMDACLHLIKSTPGNTPNKSVEILQEEFYIF